MTAIAATSPPVTNPTPAPVPPKPPSAGPRSGRLWWIGLLLVGGCVWYLPTFAGLMVSKSDVSAWMGDDLPAEVEFDSASLSWQAPVLLHDVKIREKNGASTAVIKSVTTEQTLWQLISKPTQPLTLDLEGLAAEIVIARQKVHEEGQVDTEKTLENMLQNSLPLLPRALTVRISKSEVRLVDPEKQTLTAIDGIEATYVFQPETEAAPASHEISLAGNVREPATNGNLKLQGEWQANGGTLQLPVAGAEPTLEMEKFAAVLELDRFPVNALEPTTSHFLQGKRIRGTLSGQSELYFGRTQSGSLEGFSKGALSEPLGLPVELQSQLIDVDGKPVPLDLGDIQWQLLARFDKDRDTIEFPTLEIDSAPLTLRGQGQVADVQRRALVDIHGSLRCDAEDLLAILPNDLRKELEVKGLKITEFQARGPLRTLAMDQPAPIQPALDLPLLPDNLALETTTATFPTEFQLSTNLTWESLAGYGLNSQNGDLRGSVDNGWLALQPINVPVNGGHIRNLPKVELRSDSPRFDLSKGVLLDHVQLTETAVRQWLKFVAPLLADATAVNAELSLEIAQSASGRLGHMDEADIPGLITVNQATIAPGPSMAQIQDLIDQISTLAGGRPIPRDQIKVVMPTQIIPFRVMDGRVYHKDFLLDVGDVRIMTTGSVGLDESLDLVMTIPLNDKWLQRGPILQSLQGEAMVINIRGTLKEPRFDLRPLAEFGKRLGVKAAAGLIEQLIKNPPPLPPRPIPPRRRLK